MRFAGLISALTAIAARPKRLGFPYADAGCAETRRDGHDGGRTWVLQNNTSTASGNRSRESSGRDCGDLRTIGQAA